MAQAFVWCGRSAVRPRPERPLDGAPEFAGGPGQIALHGLRNVGGTLGTAVSHGCVRLDTGAMRWLAARITPGVPVTITR
ncbi:MAG: L,D-transpeptidase [Actinobacteria bacterium]|nr:L,D-transpeptidase [Actinomycetota bacterium]